MTFLLFVRPALLQLMGAGDRRSLPALVPGHRRRSIWSTGATVRITCAARSMRRGAFAPVGRQESHALFALSRSQALARVEPETTVPAGGSVQAFVWEPVCRMFLTLTH